MKTSRWIAGLVALTLTGAAAAGGPPVALGVPLGITLGTALGEFITVGGVLPIASGGLLLVGAGSLALGVWIARRKQKR